MHKHDVDDKELLKTDGFMLDCVLQHASYEPLPLSTLRHQWRALVEYAVRSGSVALIDAGALLAGVKIEEVADKVR